MITIKKDMSYLSETDLKAVENGIATLAIHSVNLSRYYTEEQQEQNKSFSDTCTNEQWSKHCASVAVMYAQKMELIASEIAEHISVHQYKGNNTSYRSTEWDLGYWASESRDSIQLSPNKNKHIEEQLKDIEKVVNIIEGLEVENVAARIQYSVQYDENKLSEISQNVCEKFAGAFINYNGTIGKIKEISRNENEINYAFYKKGARKNCYKIDPKSLLELYFAS